MSWCCLRITFHSLTSKNETHADILSAAKQFTVFGGKTFCKEYFSTRYYIRCSYVWVFVIHIMYEDSIRPKHTFHYSLTISIQGKWAGTKTTSLILFGSKNVLWKGCTDLAHPMYFTSKNKLLNFIFSCFTKTEKWVRVNQRLVFLLTSTDFPLHPPPLPAGPRGKQKSAWKVCWR